MQSHTDAQCACIQALQEVIWKFTRWGSIQEKSRSNVTSATMLAPNPVICSNTWERTLGNDHSSATRALKLSKRINTSQNILGFIGLHRCSLQFQITFRPKIFCDEYCSFLKHLSLKTWQTAHEISKSDKHISFAILRWGILRFTCSRTCSAKIESVPDTYVSHKSHSTIFRIKKQEETILALEPQDEPTLFASPLSWVEIKCVWL